MSVLRTATPFKGERWAGSLSSQSAQRLAHGRDPWMLVSGMDFVPTLTL